MKWHVVSALLFTVAACEKSSPSDTPSQGVSRAKIDGDKSAVKPGETGGFGAGATKPGATRPKPPPRKPAPPKSPEITMPVAADLEGYVKDLPGKGPLTATIETSMGTIHCELYGDKAPATVANFVGLATGKKAWWNFKTQKVEKGVPFFDGLTFHRVIPDFMIQGGDPAGSGMGGPGYEFYDEFHKDLRHDKPGILSMAKAQDNSDGSQFFITEVPTPQLDDKHSVFGLCKEVDIVKAIARVPTGAQDKPVDAVTMTKVTITKGLPAN